MLKASTLPTHLLDTSGGHTLQNATILDIFGGGVGVVFASSVTHGISLKKCACGCDLSFITTKPQQKYVDNVHRQRAYRLRNSTATSTTKSCLWCGSSSMPKAKTAKFCCASHRTMSYRNQRKMMLTTFAQFSCTSLEDAHEIVDRVGAKKMRLVLEGANYRYDYQNRVWSRHG